MTGKKLRYPEDADHGSSEEEDFDRRNVVREARLVKIIFFHNNQCNTCFRQIGAHRATTH